MQRVSSSAFLIVFSSLVLSTFEHAIPPLTTKSSSCPYGLHYINSCKNLCSCDPSVGGSMCSRLLQCNEEKDNFCPYGDTYKDITWGDFFECYCNKDTSQTYECFDLKQKLTGNAI